MDDFRNGGFYPPPQGGWGTPSTYPYQQNPQPYAQQGGLPQAPAQTGTQTLIPGGFKPLSKEEREEAARVELEANFSFDGYQVVRREFFSHRFDPTLTIKDNSITFNNACISKLEQVVYVQLLVNPQKEMLAIRPCDEGARDAIRWCVARDDKRKSRQITCKVFTAKLYNMMGWETLYRYKLQGTRITYKGEPIYVFDLTSTEIFLPQPKVVDEATGKPVRRAPRAVFPEEWRDSFGLSVQEHEAFANIDLMEGFQLVGMSEGQSAPTQVPMEMIDQDTGEVTKV